MAHLIQIWRTGAEFQDLYDGRHETCLAWSRGTVVLCTEIDDTGQLTGRHVIAKRIADKLVPVRYRDDRDLLVEMT